MKAEKIVLKVIHKTFQANNKKGLGVFKNIKDKKVREEKRNRKMLLG